MRSDCRILIFCCFGERGDGFFRIASEVQQRQHGRVADAGIVVVQRFDQRRDGSGVGLANVPQGGDSLFAGFRILALQLLQPVAYRVIVRLQRLRLVPTACYQYDKGPYDP